jgi:glycosyltransferase involved in cell wall biosynthesis
VIGVSAHVLRSHGDFFDSATADHVIYSPLAPVGGAGGAEARAAARPPGVRTLGFLGTLSVEKGVAALLEAAPSLRSQGIILRMAGDGPLRDRVRACSQVEYLGPLLSSARTDFMTSCDAGIVPSVWDEPGLTFVALEWLAAARPVIASGRGGLAELEPLGGVMRCSPTPSGVSEAVAELADPDRYSALARQIPVVDGGRDVNRWLEQHLDVYAGACRTRDAGPVAGSP